MAPNRGTTSRQGAGKPSGKGGSKIGSKGSGRSANNGSEVRTRVSKSKVKAPPPKQQKTKPVQGPQKKKRRVYTDKELGLPKLNTITPVGVEKPRGKKKGKDFIDDRESMMTILAMVNADREGQIESKMMKARQMEEIREARKKEAEARQEEKRLKLEDTKDSMRKKRKRRSDSAVDSMSDIATTPPRSSRPHRKRVSFA